MSIEVKTFKFRKEVKLPEGWDILRVDHRFFGGYTVVGFHVEEPPMDLGSAFMGGVSGAHMEYLNIGKEQGTLEDDFSPACFLPESDDEKDMRWCDVCEQYCGPAHNHYGETIQEKDTSEWANSIHRVCDECGHEDDIFPLGSGSYGPHLDYCINCDAKWGMGQDHDRWAENYVEHDDEPRATLLQCIFCGLFSTDFDGTQDCVEKEFHEWVSFVEEAEGDEFTALSLQFVEKEWAEL